MEQGWDPDVKKYFRKILHSVCYGLLWLMSSATAGIYYHLAYRDEKPLIYIVLFYTGAFLGLILLLRYYYRTWKKV